MLYIYILYHFCGPPPVGPACCQGCNVRHEHTFVDEDAMGWLKRSMVARVWKNMLVT